APACWPRLLHPDDLRPTLDRWAHAVRTGEPYEVEYRFKDRATGGYRWHLGRALPVRDAAGRTERWFGTCTDIHDHKCAEEALREADRRKDEFLAMLAHELRNPLGPVRNAAQVLEVQSDPATVGWARAVVERQVTQLGRVFDPFAQADRSLDRSRGGLGLGLALVKGLVELHGGGVAASSGGPGRGTEVSLWLPLAGAGLPAAEGPAPAGRGPGLRVLI